METCKDENIPVYADISTGYFEAAEVSTMLALLQVIDNPYQDIPLVSVLRSPIIGLNEEELAQIRIHAKKTSFFDLFNGYAKNLSDAFVSGKLGLTI